MASKENKKASIYTKKGDLGKTQTIVTLNLNKEDLVFHILGNIRWIKFNIRIH